MYSGQVRLRSWCTKYSPTSLAITLPEESLTRIEQHVQYWFRFSTSSNPYTNSSISYVQTAEQLPESSASWRLHVRRKHWFIYSHVGDCMIIFRCELALLIHRNTLAWLLPNRKCIDTQMGSNFDGQTYGIWSLYFWIPFAECFAANLQFCDSIGDPRHFLFVGIRMGEHSKILWVPGVGRKRTILS